MKYKIGDRIRIKDGVGHEAFNKKLDRLGTDRIVTVINIAMCIYAQHESAYMIKELTFHFTEDMVEDPGQYEPIENRFEILDL